MSFFVYVLKSLADQSFYIGQTNNIDDRLRRHNAGQEKYTKSKIPWIIFWSVKLSSRAEAMSLERKLKNLKSRTRLIEYVSKFNNQSS